MVQTPDNWVVFKHIQKDEVAYRVLAGWSGGYLTGDSWSVNSGIIKVEEEPEYFLFHGWSGSIYKCRKGSYKLRMNNAHVWDVLEDRYGSDVTMMDEDTDWKGVIADGLPRTTE